MDGQGDINDLIRKAQGGDAAAFERLVAAHYDFIFRVAFKWCGHKEDAQDIAQDVCIKLARGIGGFGFQSSFTSWLYRLVINTAVDMKRKTRPVLDIADYDAPSGDAAHEEAQYTAEVLRAVQALPENEKTAILLVAAEGLSHKEAAQIMDCKESTVSWYIHEGRKKLEAMKDIEEGGRRHGR